MSEFAHYPSLVGKSVFISGGTTGIGASFVAAFARQGARVAFIGRNREAAEALIANLPPVPQRPLFIQCDVTDTAALQAAIASARMANGPISVLVNNAANDERHKTPDVTEQFWDAAIAINLRHQFFAAQAVVADMQAQGGGSIINLSSTSWKLKVPDYPAYATCKAAINGLTRSLAREFGPHRIRVNTLTPGWVMTEKQLRLWVDAAGEAEIDRSQCLPGRLQPEDLAQMALFLAADDSRMCTAQEFVVDAGWT
ncbi:Sulfoquinovose 1-dehydrogenase [Andreprevotia sp. IGB-42]|uniref:SDR family NAD(P)-dependent oxidoreductase n=1 Tax=Andreprevotia sp. IGB-42 TaxID=2497473 RepID=UPI00135B94E6|nr:SDR family oxidoreductase [Andreprevotia sp. IGB-42]KAF0814479.1 Sulfoquinovose 1-dehydrogenase [Andreprevotia sp. IGB-42]